MSSEVGTNVTPNPSQHRPFKNLVIIKAIFNNILTETLIDTGASINVIPPSLSTQSIPSQQRLIGISGTAMAQFKTVCNLTFPKIHKIFKFEATLLEIPRPIIGNEFMMKNNFKINFPRKEIEIGNSSIPFYLSSEELNYKNFKDLHHSINLTDRKMFPSSQYSFIAINCPIKGLFTPNEKFLEENNLLMSEIYIPNPGLIHLPILNPNAYPIHVNSFVTIGNMSEVQDIIHLNYEYRIPISSLAHVNLVQNSSISFEGQGQGQDSSPVKSDTVLKFNINPKLNPIEFSELSKLLNEFSSVFATSQTEAGLYNGPELMRINTGDHPPISQPPYRKSHTERKLIQEHIKELLQKGII